MAERSVVKPENPHRYQAVRVLKLRRSEGQFAQVEHYLMAFAQTSVEAIFRCHYPERGERVPAVHDHTATTPQRGRPAFKGSNPRRRGTVLMQGGLLAIAARCGTEGVRVDGGTVPVRAGASPTRSSFVGLIR